MECPENIKPEKITEDNMKFTHVHNIMKIEVSGK